MAITSNTATHVTVASYLFTRLSQLGIRSIFGVPGDYNLKLLDYVVPNDLHWVGNCNELNAAYAADGYARVLGLSALITTFGVGELSAINGIAGSYAEKAPVIHIVGTPARKLQQDRVLMHHTFADGEYRNFAAMSVHVTAAQTNLKDPRTAGQQIDWIIEQAIIHSRPVYLELPDDMVNILIPIGELTQGKISPPEIIENKEEDAIVDSIWGKVSSAHRPVILVDGEIRPAGIVQETEELVRATEWPTWTAPFGKGLLNEELPNVYGIYNGITAHKEAQDYFKSADLVIHLGPHLSDTNTQGWTATSKAEITVFLSPGAVKLPNASFRDVSCKRILRTLLRRIRDNRAQVASVEGPAKSTGLSVDVADAEALRQKEFFHVINPSIRSGDIVLTETGTAAHGGRELSLPNGVKFFSAITWLSIGYMLPATLGASLAQRDMASADTSPDSGRTILVIGDGSLQMTAQEISTMIKEKLNILIIIINNDGYTIERVIHGRKEQYNDIATWRNLQALSYFGADRDQCEGNTFSARTWGELKSALGSETLRDGKGVRMLEVFMEREDCSGVLVNLLESQKALEEKTGLVNGAT